MATLPVVENFHVIEQASACLDRSVVLYSQCITSSDFRVWKKLSIGALTLLCQDSRMESAKSAKINGYSSRTM